ncbi:pseudouridine synthase [Beijerinckia sp. L45]|uniref:pseudouridine synthase n=1 Tax=Beijerinckia sp. L45 TaxID=1641855 RepID=UPI00131E0448|nr:pseudouridine synthase [Beijerinckia sp. L45]
MSKPASAVRLDKLLANLGYGSRRDVQAMARAGRVTLDGAALPTAEARVAMTPDLAARLQIDGTPLDPLPGIVLMLNKPLGMTCSHKDEGALVYSLLPERWRLREPPISSVGRLDKDTSGLLLLTDDGDLLHRIIAPKTHVPKRYQVGLARPLRGDEADLFASGTLTLAGEAKPLLPALIEIHTSTQAALTITEGRYHQVRRMFAATGNHVVTLHRDRVGALDLPADLAVGTYRALGLDAAALIFPQ